MRDGITAGDFLYLVGTKTSGIRAVLKVKSRARQYWEGIPVVHYGILYITGII